MITVAIFIAAIIPGAPAARHFYQKRTDTEPRCHCNYTEVFTQLPYFLQELGRTEHFDWAFQGKKGDRGADGPQGPPGLPGRNGQPGSKGERGEPGVRGLPGKSLVFNAKGSLFGNGERGEKGDAGKRGPTGKKGDKGEPGTVFTTVLKDGGYIQVKGERGDRGNRGKKGEKGDKGETGSPGAHGLSIEGRKGDKGEPAILPDPEYFRGLPGPRGPPGLPGYPGRGCPDRHHEAESPRECNRQPIIFQRKGEKGDQGHPGLSIVGEKGEPGLGGPPGPPGTLPDNFLGSFVFKSTKEMLAETQTKTGGIAVVTDVERAFIKMTSGWKEIILRPYVPRGQQENSVVFRGNSNALTNLDEELPRKVYFLDKTPLQTSFSSISSLDDPTETPAPEASSNKHCMGATFMKKENVNLQTKRWQKHKSR